MSRLVVSLKSQHNSSKPVIPAASLLLTPSLCCSLREYFVLQAFIPLWISLLLPLFWFCLERQTLSGSQQPEVYFFLYQIQTGILWDGSRLRQVLHRGAPSHGCSPWAIGDNSTLLWLPHCHRGQTCRERAARVFSSSWCFGKQKAFEIRETRCLHL